jgi:hypothetical protein
MYLMYVDESGDPGVVNSPTKYFTLSSLIVHELRWQACLDQLIAFRRRIRDKYGLKMNEEIHGAAMINRPGALVRINRNDRLTIIRAFADEITKLPDVNSINVVIVKRPSDTKDTVFDRAWSTLIQRFENTLARRNFPGPMNADERGILFCDNTDERLNRLLRKMRRYNPIPNQATFGSGYRDIKIKYVIEDPVHRNSAATYFVQAVDTIAFLLYQRGQPSSYMKKVGGRRYFNRLEPILCKWASNTHPLGIVIR